jgi:hypothetical protein
MDRENLACALLPIVDRADQNADHEIMCRFLMASQELSPGGGTLNLHAILGEPRVFVNVVRFTGLDVLADL